MRPRPGADEVLIEVHATSINPLDWKIRSGAFKIVTGRRFPKVLGADVAGVVVALGPRVSELRVGELVYGFIPIYKRKPGALAEYVPVAAERVRKLPEGLPFEHAAALPVAALTALNGLRQCGELAENACW